MKTTRTHGHRPAGMMLLDPAKQSMFVGRRSIIRPGNRMGYHDPESRRASGFAALSLTLGEVYSTASFYTLFPERSRSD